MKDWQMSDMLQLVVTLITAEMALNRVTTS